LLPIERCLQCRGRIGSAFKLKGREIGDRKNSGQIEFEGTRNNRT